MRIGILRIARKSRAQTGRAEQSKNAAKILRAAIELILEDRLDDALRGLPSEAIRETVVVGV